MDNWLVADWLIADWLTAKLVGRTEGSDKL